MNELLGHLVIVCALLLAVACTPSQLQVGGEIANAMHAVQVETGPMILDLRRTAMIGAAQAVHDSGGDEVAARAASAAMGVRWQCGIDGHRLYSTMVGSLIDVLWLQRLAEDFQLTTLLPFIGRGADAYRAFQSCLVSLGSDLLPEVPAFGSLIPPAWNGR